MLDDEAHPIQTLHLSMHGLAELETRGEYGMSRLQDERTHGGLFGGRVQSHSGQERFPCDHYVLCIQHSKQCSAGGSAIFTFPAKATTCTCLKNTGKFVSKRSVLDLSTPKRTQRTRLAAWASPRSRLIIETISSYRENQGLNRLSTVVATASAVDVDMAVACPIHPSKQAAKPIRETQTMEVSRGRAMSS